jgi:hypothetical protein
LCCRSNAAYDRKSSYNDGKDHLPSCQIDPTADDLNWLSVPVKATIAIYADAIGFSRRDRPNAFRPMAFVDPLKGDALKLFCSLRVQPRRSLCLGLHHLFPLRLQRQIYKPTDGFRAGTPFRGR